MLIETVTELGNVIDYGDKVKYYRHTDFRVSEVLLILVKKYVFVIYHIYMHGFEIIFLLDCTQLKTSFLGAFTLTFFVCLLASFDSQNP